MIGSWWIALLACGAGPVAPSRVDLGVGTVEAPAGFVAERTGTLDSQMGTITAADGGLVVGYDIGAMAGARVTAATEGCDALETLDAGGVPTFVCIRAVDGRQEIVATVGTHAHKGSYYPANFRATVGAAERDGVIAIVTSYRPAAGTNSVLVYVPRGIGAVATGAGPRLELTMEADPVPVEVTIGASLGHRTTWTRVGAATPEVSSTRCGAQLQGETGPADAGAVYGVEIEVFETLAPCAADWAPEREGYRELHRAVID